MEKKILVACGTGIATSTIVCKKLEEKLEENGIKNKIIQCKVTEVPSRCSDADLIVTTTPLEPINGIPVIRAMSFLTGIGMDDDVRKIIAILKESD